MSSDLYCRLYIDSVCEEEALRREIADIVDGATRLRAVENSIISINCKKNEAASDSASKEFGGFVHYPFLAELQPIHEVVDGHETVEAEVFLSLLVHLIKELRNSGALVVAACGYEDLIAERTGWNWSEATPHHPPASLDHG